MSGDSKLVTKAANHVYQLYVNELPDYCLFHNYRQSEDLLKICEELGEKNDLSENQIEALQIASLFLYTGYTDPEKDTVETSRQLADRFLSEQQYAGDCKSLVNNLIKYYYSDQEPPDLSTRVFHDVTHAYYGRKRFFRLKELQKMEKELAGETLSDDTWERETLQELISHRFYTKPARKAYGSRKQKNIEKQSEKLKEVQEGKKYGRGVETLYRANYRNHINLSAIADGKANMMISLNTIILSVIITISGAGFTISENFLIQQLQFVLPVVILILGATLSVVFAILSARPTVTSKEKDEKIEDKDLYKDSFLYFGNFLNLGKSGFTTYLNRLKSNQGQLYDSMSKDIYNLGKVLNKKYKLLNYSYNCFMIGLIISVISFLIVILTKTYI